MNSYEKNLAKIGEILEFAAAGLFNDCGAGVDFCIQLVGDERVIFGGVNRVIWEPLTGFSPDRSCCTERFLAEWDALHGGGLITEATTTEPSA
jgi:hypothetical protein